MGQHGAHVREVEPLLALAVGKLDLVPVRARLDGQAGTPGPQAGSWPCLGAWGARRPIPLCDGRPDPSVTTGHGRQAKRAARDASVGALVGGPLGPAGRCISAGWWCPPRPPLTHLSGER